MKTALLIALGAAFWLLRSNPLADGSDELALSPRLGVLLLENGELIAGRITTAGDRYDVNLEDGEIHIQRSKVALVASSADECYQFKRAGIEQGRVQDHLELAEWCLRNGLLEAAEKEINAARAADSTHPKIRLVETRLKLARENPPNLEPIKSGEKNANHEQLDAMVRNLPPGAMEVFTNSIQPLLLNHCSRSGCHGATAAGALRLERIPPNRRAGRKPTQRNLFAALTLIDRANPGESKLLTAPLGAHGNSKAPIFSDREVTQYKLLVQWVYSVSGSKQSSAPSTLIERTAPLLQTVPQSVVPGGREPASEAVEQESAAPPTEGNAQASSNDISRAANIPPGQFRITRVKGQAVLRPLAKQGEDATGFVPKDPFDPAIFNRRFFGE